jgi:hypothetical protein
MFLLFNILISLFMKLPIENLLTPFEKGNGNQTCTYDECISYYRQLDAKFDEAKLIAYGNTAVGKPVHLLVISADKSFDPVKIHEAGKCVLLIDNGIHPGEPDGIDASMMFARDVLTKKDLHYLLDHVVICIIPVYNVSGMLNRGSFSRANQNGPEDYGFRGTAQNYDLNRDFVKCDSREAQTFTEIFQTWKPELMVDTHVSNGADYQYVMTLIPSQKDKLQSFLADYQEKTLLPDLYAAMKASGFEMTPYVNPVKEIPDSGIAAFLETPRYSTGYSALFNCIGMMPETHMLKAYSSRVDATYQLIKNVAAIANRDYQAIMSNKKKADEMVSMQKEFPLDWKLDEEASEEILFKGYEAKYKKSDVSGSMRLWYDRAMPYERPVKYFNNYIAAASAEKPFAYIIPQGWEKVIERLKWNGVVMHRLSEDTTLEVNVYRIDDMKSSPLAFEGHHFNSEVKVHSEREKLSFYKGDYVVFPDQSCNRYIVEMLEPQGVDSYFTWNFFDAILMEKEYFSAYVFEDAAAELLKSDVKLRDEFEAKKKADGSFAQDPQAQLDYLYRHSPYFEKSFRRYPVARIEEPTNLNVR